MISPGHQEASGRQARYFINLLMDPSRPHDFTFDFGDGTHEDHVLPMLPEGELRVHSLVITHEFPGDISALVDLSGNITQTLRVLGGGSETVTTHFGPPTPTRRLVSPAAQAGAFTLLPGADGTLPVRARWVATTEIPEALAVDDEVVYIVGEVLTAFDVSDGSVVWEYVDEGQALVASGGVVVGLDGPDVVRVIAPWAYDLSVERRTGRLLSKETPGAVLPTTFSAFARRDPTSFRVQVGLEETVAYRPDGGVAWRLLVERPMVDPQPAAEAGGAIILVTASQHVVALEAAP